MIKRREPRKWTVTLTIVDTPEEAAGYMTKSEIRDELFRHGCSSDGIKALDVQIKKEA